MASIEIMPPAAPERLSTGQFENLLSEIRQLSGLEKGRATAQRDAGQEQIRGRIDAKYAELRSAEVACSQREARRLRRALVDLKNAEYQNHPERIQALDTAISKLIPPVPVTAELAPEEPRPAVGPDLSRVTVPNLQRSVVRRDVVRRNVVRRQDTNEPNIVAGTAQTAWSGAYLSALPVVGMQVLGGTFLGPIGGLAVGAVGTYFMQKLATYAGEQVASRKGLMDEIGKFAVRAGTVGAVAWLLPGAIPAIAFASAVGGGIYAVMRLVKGAAGDEQPQGRLRAA